jgi:hypothetical protein
MSSDTAIKLFFGTAAFVFIAFAGIRYKRVTGVLLTFPILNGLALLTGAAPYTVANAIYPVVVFNSLLFFAAISYCPWVPPLARNLHHLVKFFARVLCWSVLWGCGAFVLTYNRSSLPSGWILFLFQSCIVALFFYFGWTPRSLPAESAESRPGFFGMWRQFAILSMALRFAAFLVAFLLVLYVAAQGGDAKWVGMVSALPLPGICALAMLSADDADHRNLYPIRDTVLLGPLLVIPFNGAFSFVAINLPAGLPGSVLGIAVLVAFWLAAGCFVFFTIPGIARILDRWHQKG